MSAYPLTIMSGLGASVPTLVSPPQNIFAQTPPSYALGLVCTVSNGASIEYSVQVTADPKPSSSGNWNDHDVITVMTQSINSNIAFPVTGVRLNVTNWVSGSVTMGIAQWP